MITRGLYTGRSEESTENNRFTRSTDRCKWKCVTSHYNVSKFYLRGEKYYVDDFLSAFNVCLGDWHEVNGLELFSKLNLCEVHCAQKDTVHFHMIILLILKCDFRNIGYFFPNIQWIFRAKWASKQIFIRKTATSMDFDQFFRKNKKLPWKMRIFHVKLDFFTNFFKICYEKWEFSRILSIFELKNSFL